MYVYRGRVKDTVWFELTVFLALIDVTLRSCGINMGKKIQRYNL